MTKYKGLILYAGCGGFRHGVNDYDNNIEWTAVEMDTAIADCYKSLFPEDNVIIGDAQEYLLEHYREFDFIQSSPPCQTHSRLRYALGVLGGKCKPVLPDLKLWQEIVFLEKHYKGIYLIENVIPYYNDFINLSTERRYKIDRHYIWSNADLSKINKKFNFNLPFFSTKSSTGRIRQMSLEKMKDRTFFDISKFPKIKNKRQVLRNMFEPEIAKYVFSFIYEQMKNKE